MNRNEQISLKIRVEVDADLEALMPNYLINKGKEIKTLRDVIANHDYKTIRFIGRADEYMVKPFSIVEFEMRLKKLMFTEYYV